MFENVHVVKFLSYSNLILYFVSVYLISRALYKTLKEKARSPQKDDEIIDKYEPEPLVEEVAEPESSIIIKGKAGLYLNIDGVDCLNFATHDYYNFIGNQEVENKAIECISQCGIGTCGPPLFYGTNVKHLEFQKALSEFLNCEQAIIYPQGFAAVSSAIAVYVKASDVVFADEKVNFAIQSGLKASRGIVKLFKHNDENDLKAVLKSSLNGKKTRGFLILEGIYMNTGNICALPKLIDVAKEYKLRIFIDETISFCTLGQTGKGITEHFGVPVQDIDLIMGSFEHALGSGGGFSAGSRLLIEHQVLCGQGHIFSAALPPFLVSAASEALKQIQNEPDKIQQLKNVCKSMHNGLLSSEKIKNLFTIHGSEESPVHVLALRNNIAKTTLEQTTLMKLILKFSLSYKTVFSNFAHLSEMEVDEKISSLRIVSRVTHTEDHISQCLKILETIHDKLFDNDL